MAARAPELRLNASLDYSVDEATFHATPELRSNYTSPHEICLLRRLFLRPFSMRAVLQDFVDHTFFTVVNPSPENGEPDRDEDGELAHVHDVIQTALRLDDEDLFLFVFLNLMHIYAPLREAMAEQSNLYLLRCLMAFVRYAVTLIHTSCVVTATAQRVVHGFVEAARDLVLNGITTPALYLTYIHNHYQIAEDRIQHSNPLRFAPSLDLPPEYHLFMAFVRACPFFRSPWEPHDAAGFEQLKGDLGLPPHTVLEQGNMGASTPGSYAARIHANEKVFPPENVFYVPNVAVQKMSLWTFVTFHTTLARNNFRPPDPKMATRAQRAMQRLIQRQAVSAERKRKRGGGSRLDRSGSDSDGSGSGSETDEFEALE